MQMNIEKGSVVDAPVLHPNPYVFVQRQFSAVAKLLRWAMISGLRLWAHV